MRVNPKKYSEIKRKYFPSLTKKQFSDVIRRHQLQYNTETGEVLVYDFFDLAMNRKHMQELIGQHGEDWIRYYNVGLVFENHWLKELTTQQIMCNDFPFHIPEQEKLIPLPDLSTAKPSKKTHIIGSPVKETTIRLFCKDCRKPLSPGTVCGHPDERLKYQARFYKIQTQVIRRWLDATTAQEAIIEAHNLKLVLGQADYNPKMKVEHPKKASALVKDLLDDYFGFTRNEGVSKNLRSTKNRTPGYIDERIRYLGFFKDALIQSGFNMERLTPNQFSEKMADNVYEYLDKLICKRTGKIYSAFSFNKFIGEISSFNLYLIKKKMFKIENHFGNLKKKSTDYYKPVAISKAEINNVLDKIEELKETDYHHDNFNHIDLKFWLRDAFLLELATNRRREDFLYARWCDIYEEDGDEYLKVRDFKISRQKDTDVYEHILIGPELKIVLLAMRYNEYIETNEYLVFPESFQRELIARKMFKKVNGRTRLMYKLSSSFGVLYELAGGKRNLGAKSLKKAGITILSAVMKRDEVHLRTGHQSSAIVNKHYVDSKMKAKIRLEARLEKTKKEDALAVNPASVIPAPTQSTDSIAPS